MAVERWWDLVSISSPRSPLSLTSAGAPRRQPYRPALERLEERRLLAAAGPDPLLSAYVGRVYQDLLRRDADPGGLAAWTGRLQAGWSRPQMILGFEASPEYQTLQVQDLYRRYLGREADPGGLGHQVAMLQQGASFRDIETSILGSPEYYSNRAGGTPTMYVIALYRDLFDRATDAGALGFEVSLNGGAPAGAIVPPLLGSREAAGRVLEQFYQRFLGRSADPSGGQLFTPLLQQWGGREQVLAHLLGSDEYLQQSANPASMRDQRYGALVGKLFTDQFDRPPDGSEVADWTNRFTAAAAAGTPISTVLLSLLNSTESLRTLAAGWRQSLLGDGRAVAELKASSDVDAIAGALQQGDSFTLVLSQVLAGDEFYQAAGGTDDGFVRRLYDQVLGRAAPQPEVDGWVARLQTATRQQVATLVLDSDEAVRTVVAGWYVTYLRRPESVAAWKNAPEITRWVQRLAEYNDRLAVLAEFLASQEYLGFPADLYDAVTPVWSSAAGPFAQPAGVQRGDQPTLRSGQPIIATSYFYWYGSDGARFALQYPDGASALTHHPPTMDGFSYQNVAWHQQQLTDMIAAGIDVVLPVSYGTPFSDPLAYHGALENRDPVGIDFSDVGLRRLATARRGLVDEGQTPPRVGMFYDTTTLGGLNGSDYWVDLSSYGGKRWFYETIRNFFSHVPATAWARVDGRPVVFVYHPSMGKNVDGQLYAAVRGWFQHDFGTDLYIVTGAEEVAPLILTPSELTPWIARLNVAGIRTVLAEMLSDAEFYRAAGGTDEGFVRRLYDKVLMRPPEPSGLASWTASLRFLSRRQVVDRFLASDEANRVLVAGWLRAYLRRPDPLPQLMQSPDVEPYVSALDAGADVETVLSEFLGTDAFLTASGGEDGLIDNLYQQLALRAATPAEHDQWNGFLAQVQRAVAIREFLRSDDVRRALVSGWLFYYWGRYYPGQADSEFYWSGALAPTFRAVASLGPGYDQSAIRDRPPLVVPRDDGRHYQAAWEELLAMQPRPWFVHLETWNEYFEGSDIAESREFGRTYIDLTRAFADRFHQS
jgi:Domain of unknown function (DUF4214)/Domain of unknown function (DUF5010)